MFSFEQLPCCVIVGGQYHLKGASDRYALPYIPNLARVTAEYRDCLKSASCLVGVDLEYIEYFDFHVVMYFIINTEYITVVAEACNFFLKVHMNVMMYLIELRFVRHYQ